MLKAFLKWLGLSHTFEVTKAFCSASSSVIEVRRQSLVDVNRTGGIPRIAATSTESILSCQDICVYHYTYNPDHIFVRANNEVDRVCTRVFFQTRMTWHLRPLSIINFL